MALKKKVSKRISKRVLFKRIRAVSILVGLCCLGMRGCAAVEESQTMLVLRNQSSNTLNFMQVKLRDKTFEIRNVLPGQEHIWKFKRSGEDSFTVNGRLAATVPITISSLGSLASDRNREHRLTIDEHGKVSYSSPK
ncbi:hypothetical protein NIES3974_47850 [Calothrix sp. NIES-3974]|nr:hypothetical protein NIES3974_47850 [Calothrix sp. NIES-3974]